MGCGASANDKTTLKPIPLQTAQSATPEAVLPPKKQTPSLPEKANTINEKKPSLAAERDKKDLRSSTTKETSKAKNESKTNLQNSTNDLRSSSTQKKLDSVGKNNETKGKVNDLRNSSLGKSQSGTKLNNQSPAKKNVNPQDPTKLKMSESVIDQEQELKKTQQKDKDKTIKKIKSVKNNKELTDLIKIYGL